MRKTSVAVTFDGVDVSEDVSKYLKSLSYTDSEDGEADDLQLSLADKDAVWMQKWLNNRAVAAYLGVRNEDDAGKGITISAKILYEDDNDVDELDCGLFYLDSIGISGPPPTVSIKASSLPVHKDVKSVKQSRSWERYSLSGIAAEIAASGGLMLLYLSQSDPQYGRLEQYGVSNIAFLRDLCVRAGLSVKVSGGMLIVYEKSEYEIKKTVAEIRYGDGRYTNFKLATNAVGTSYTSCHVAFTRENGDTISGWAFSEKNSDRKTDNVLEVIENVASVAEAENLAAALLKDATALEYVVTFTMPGNPRLVAGCTVRLAGFGAWDGSYMIKTAKHVVGDGGYSTSLTLRRVWRDDE